MTTVETLIAECAGLCGSQNALARAIGTTPGRMSDYRTGRVPIPPPHLAALCEMAQIDGDEARRLLAACECDNPKNQAHREKMRRAFFACWAVGVMASAALPMMDQPIERVDTIHIVVSVAFGLCVLLASDGRPLGNRRAVRFTPGTSTAEQPAYTNR